MCYIRIKGGPTPESLHFYCGDKKISGIVSASVQMRPDCNVSANIYLHIGMADLSQRLAELQIEAEPGEINLTAEPKFTIAQSTKDMLAALNKDQVQSLIQELAEAGGLTKHELGVIQRADGSILAESEWKEETAWQVALGWPTDNEIEDVKRKGWRYFIARFWD